jgi:uncharacterized membrane protein
MDRSQPQTLQAAVMLAYINAGLGVLYLLLGAGLSLILVLLGVAAFGIANERKWGYWSAIVVTGLFLVTQVATFFLGGGFASLITLLFAAVLFALLVHPESRQYQKVWFH